MKESIKDFFYKLWIHLFVTRKIYKIYNFCAMGDKINPRKIVFVNYYGAGYGDNGKYIADYILDNNLNFEIVWLVDKKKNKGDFPSRIRLVNYFSFAALKELSTAKYWIDNARKSFFPKKKKGQIYIQTWHGSGVLKMIEMDAPSLPKRYIKQAKEDSKIIDYILSGCEFKSNIYRNKFWYNGEVLNIGTPRSDLFFDVKKINQAKDKILRYYNINNDKKVLLYAPTFRQTESLEPYRLNYESLQKCLKQKFGYDWKILVKLHPNVAKLSNQLDIPESVLNVTSYPDMQELLCSADIVISDYSGLMFDFYLLNRPIFMFCSDYYAYKEKERDLYFSLDELPFPMSLTNEQLIENILAFDETVYLKRVRNFKERIGLCEKGTACKSVINLLSRGM